MGAERSLSATWMERQDWQDKTTCVENKEFLAQGMEGRSQAIEKFSLRALKGDDTV